MRFDVGVHISYVALGTRRAQLRGWWLSSNLVRLDILHEVSEASMYGYILYVHVQIGYRK